MVNKTRIDGVDIDALVLTRIMEQMAATGSHDKVESAYELLRVS